MATTADITFRIDGQDVDTFNIRRGESVDLELYVKGGDFVTWNDINNDPNLNSSDQVDSNPVIVFLNAPRCGVLHCRGKIDSYGNVVDPFYWIRKIETVMAHLG